MSINQYTMCSLLDNQRVRKRKIQRPDLKALPHRSDSHKSGYKAFRPKGIVSLFEKNTRVIEAIRQNPAKFSYKKQSSAKPDYRLSGPKEQNYAVSAKRRLPSIAFPVLPITALFLLGLGALFVAYGEGALSWISREVLSPEKDNGSQYNLALYAGINPAENAAQSLPGSLSDSNGALIPIDLMETFTWQTYKVKKGDSVSKIAAAFSVSMDAIISSNGITNVRALREGQTLRIPNMDGIPYTVKTGDSLSRISQAMGVPLEAILDANDIQSDIINAGTSLFIPGARMSREDLKMALGELFIYPLKGSRLSSPFGWRDDPISGVRRHHAAVDLSAPQGTPVFAAMEGTVLVLSYDRTYGNFIILSHPGGYQTMYAHLNSFSIKQGGQVAQGAQIGTVGNTGYSTGPHLHFAIFKNSRAVNPLDLMNSQR